MTEPDPNILVRRVGAVGWITLNRPKALNALTRPMMAALDEALIDWASDPEIRCVLIDGAGDRAFCSGGDVRAIYEQSKAGDHAFGRDLWREEYRMNARIAAYPKPFVALMDGIVMGGGVGASAHGSHRFVTERSLVAMPECMIGLVPDIGGTHLLARAPGRLGEFLGVTGHRMSADEAIYAGFADRRVESADLPALRERLLETADPDGLTNASRSGGTTAIAAAQSEIDRVFALPSGSDILAALSESDADWASTAHAQIAAASPLSVEATLRLVRAARAAPGVEAALTREYRFVSRATTSGEFLEGVRAALVDKDRSPKWRIDAPSDADVDAMLAAAEGGELELDENGGSPR